MNEEHITESDLFVRTGFRCYNVRMMIPFKVASLSSGAKRVSFIKFV